MTCFWECVAKDVMVIINLREFWHYFGSYQPLLTNDPKYDVIVPRQWSHDQQKKTIIWVFNQWFDNLYSFLHPAKHGFLFILKNVLFKEIHDTEIPITCSKKMI